MPNVLVLGAVSYDTILKFQKLPCTPGDYAAQEVYRRSGGHGTAKAIALSRLGAKVRLFAPLGSDEAGTLVLRELEEARVEATCTQAHNGTPLEIRLLDEAGDCMTLCMNPCTFAERLPEEALREAMDWAEIIVLHPLPYLEPLLCALPQKPVWTDLSDYDPQTDPNLSFVRASDVLFLSSDRLTDARATLRALGTSRRLVIATHGKEGSTAYQEGRFYEQSAHNFNLVDSVGAGDNYFAGFLIEYAKKQHLERSLMTASVCGGLAIETQALVPKELTLDLVETTLLARGIL
ncbi:hypothetical protein ABB02_00035 [Clostridiaceae bacterium JG1575]|nr:hypothetical protein ABB02_00035 [Clostridiaceae bacterium JG1575]